MYPVEDYYRINRILLKVSGLWPYQDPRWARGQGIIMTSMFVSILFVQVLPLFDIVSFIRSFAVFITHEYSLSLFIEVCSLIFPTSLSLLLYLIYYFNSDNLREVMDRIYYDWKCCEDKTEFDVMNTYASTSKRITHVFLLLMYLGILITLIFHSVPVILDVVWPLNDSRPREIYMTVEYFVDSHKYYYILASHLVVSACLGGLIGLVISLTFLAYMFHVCGLFKVASYRMQIMMNEGILQIPSPKREHVISERIVRAVDIHRKAIQWVYKVSEKLLCKLIMSNLERSFLVVTIIGVASLSINMFRLFEAITKVKGIIEFCISIALVVIHSCYLFFANHVGQRITNNNIEIFNAVYNLPWYVAPLSIQKLLLFLLQNGSKNFYLSIGGIFYSSYETFVMLLTSSISYFTIIYAIQ